MSVQVEGAIVTDNIVSVLKKWQINDNVPEIHVEKLCELQDFFCRLLINDYPDIDQKGINDHLMAIIDLKDDLKMFNLNSNCDTDSPNIK